MAKKTNKAAEAQGAEAQDKKVSFNLNEIGYTDLDGNRIPMVFNQKEFGNLVYFHSPTIEMEAVARSLHASGVAECTHADLDVIRTIVDKASPYNRITKQAINEYITFLKGE